MKKEERKKKFVFVCFYSNNMWKLQIDLIFHFQKNSKTIFSLN